ncbi:MAG TPA: GtrA family protein [Candidatus Binatia bacterium]|nr:GtrA family protein [Candidatus Binatia bacterium]
MSIFTRQPTKLWGQRVVRFVIVGCFNTLLDTSLLLIMVNILGWQKIVANSLSVSIAITTSYFLNHRIVFREPESYSLKKYLRFFAVTGLGVILIQDLVIYLITDKLVVLSSHKSMKLLGRSVSERTIELVVAKLIGVMFGMIWNFLLYKYVVFKIRGGSTEPKEEKLIVG